MRNLFPLLLLALLYSNSATASTRNLSIVADQNISSPLTKIARLYSQKSNVVVSAMFNPSHKLLDEIDSGEPVDIFISTDSSLIESLKQKGLVDVYNIGYIAHANKASEPNKIIDKSQSGVFYQAFIIAGENMETGREFLKFLKSDGSSLILREAGFVVD